MLIQFIINGIILGAIYATMALGFALVYNTTKIFHIAYAVLYMVSGYFLYSFFNQWQFNFFLSSALAIAITVLFSIFIEFSVYQPLIKKKASLNVILISSLGVMIVVINFIALIYGNETKIIHNEIAKSVHFGHNAVIVTYPQFYQLIFSLLFITGVYLLLEYTPVGIRIRALKDDEELAKVQGIDITKYRLIIFAVSGFLAALSGILMAQDIGIDPYIGMPMLLNAVVAMIIGGIGKFYPAILGGFILGIIQALVVWKFSANWQEAITFMLLILFLIFRPQGILGTKTREI